MILRPWLEIRRLNGELEMAKNTIADLQQYVTKCSDLQKKVDDLNRVRDKLITENTFLIENKSKVHKLLGVLKKSLEHLISSITDIKTELEQDVSLLPNDETAATVAVKKTSEK